MAKKKIDLSLQRLRNLFKPDTDFSDMMKHSGMEGCFKIMNVASDVMPDIIKLAGDKINKNSSMEEMMAVFREPEFAAEAKKLMAKNGSMDIFRSTLGWMLQKGSMQNMVDIQRDLMNNADVPTAAKQHLAKSMSGLIDSTIDTELCSVEEWEEYNKLGAAINNDDVVGYSLKKRAAKAKNKKRPISKEKVSQKDVSLKDLLLCNETDKDRLIEKIVNHAKGRCIGVNAAYMIAALRELGYVESGSSGRRGKDTYLHKALGEYFHIGSRQGVFRDLNSGVIKYTDQEVQDLIPVFQL